MEVAPQVRRIVRRAVSCAGVDDDLEEALVGPNMEWLKRAAAVDKAYQELLQTVRRGFPENKDEIPKSVLPYFTLRKELSEWQGLVILRCQRIVIPIPLRREVLERLHATHQGIDRTQRWARAGNTN